MAVTLKDVARQARVALGTASRVLNDHADVNPALRKRVEQAIQELNYRPNARARSFVRDSSPVISFILSNRSLLHPVHSRILQGVEEYCEQAGHFVMFTRFQYTPDTRPSQLRLPRVLRSRGIADSVILAGTNYDNFVEAIESLSAPYIMLGNNFITSQEPRDFDQVCSDDFAGAFDATKYLLQLGHRHIWYIGDIALPWFKVCWEAYSEAMNGFGLEPLGYTVGLADNYYANGYACAELLLARKAPVTAIFAGGDDVAYGAWDLLQKRGLRVPHDISIIGFNDQDDAQFKTPPLTTVRVNTIEIGRRLGKMAIEKLRAPTQRFPEVIVPVALIKRGTVRPPSECPVQQLADSSVASVIGAGIP